MGIHLSSIRYRHDSSRSSVHPFQIPVIRTLSTLEFPTPVTMFVGENGSGKSTLLEAIAVAANAIAVGDADLFDDASLSPANILGAQLKLTWKQRTHKGFFLRAEDFINFARRVEKLRVEAQKELEDIDDRMAHRSEYAKQLARLPHLRTRGEIESLYERDLEAFSHGESFFELFKSRIQPNGLYLFDEPEAPLSPTKQLALMMLLQEMVRQNCQFIIATHSPMLMALPGATLYSFDNPPIRSVRYDELEHVQLMRDFLNHPEQFLRHL